MAVKIKDVQGWMESNFPAVWAEKWDRIGLQIGDPETVVDRIGVSLEATGQSASWAIENNLQLLITHHPLFFEPITSLTSLSEPGRTALRLIEGRVALFTAHTNLDVAPEGVSTALARQLGLTHLVPLETGTRDRVKVVVYVPAGYEERVLTVLEGDRIGEIGHYRRCTFKVRGEGTFQGDQESRPFRGEPARLERADEWRLEFQTGRDRLAEVLERIRAVHPYEETAYDIYPLENPAREIGMGRVGRFDPPLPMETLLGRLKADVDAPVLRVSGKTGGPVEKVAVCGGSGARLLTAARAAGAEVFITGEIGYHPLVANQGQPLVLIEIGHYPSEKWILPGLRKALAEAGKAEGWGIEVLEFREKGDPYCRCY
jgi:dinuclear metal center YbgI/SA1388 family protein